MHKKRRPVGRLFFRVEFFSTHSVFCFQSFTKVLKMFDESGMDKISPTTAVNKAKEVINRY